MDQDKLIKMALGILKNKSHKWRWALKQLRQRECLMRVSWDGDRYARWYPNDVVTIYDFKASESNEYCFTMDDFDADDWILQSDWEELFDSED